GEEGCGMARGVLRVACRLALGLAAGLALGAGYWAADLAWRGDSIASAIQGQVDDGVGLVMGLAALGGLCGAGVGPGSGLAAFGRSRAGPGAAAGRPRD